MGNIVSTWEEIELTDAELQIIYGAQDCDDNLLMVRHCGLVA